MNDEWYEIEINKFHSGNTTSLQSRKFVHSWWMIFTFTILSVSKISIEIEAVCSCNNFYKYRCRSCTIPPNTESVVVACKECKNPMLKITGIVSGDYKVFI